MTWSGLVVQLQCHTRGNESGGAFQKHYNSAEQFIFFTGIQFSCNAYWSGHGQVLLAELFFVFVSFIMDYERDVTVLPVREWKTLE